MDDKPPRFGGVFFALKPMARGARRLLRMFATSLALSTVIQAHADDATDLVAVTLVGTEEFKVTSVDVKNYLRALYREYDEEFEWGSSLRVNKAIVDLFALNVMSRWATEEGILASVDKAWLSEYLWSMEAATMLAALKAEQQMLEVAWEALAEEHYLVNRDNFRTQEQISIRTLLLRVGERSYMDAWQLAESLLEKVRESGDFEAMVLEWSEDEMGKAQRGLMRGVTRGETVPPFEEAAFMLASPGDLSGPVATQFGVHLIQLIDREPSRQQAFEEVREDIISELKPLHRSKLLEGIRQEARVAEPEGFFIDREAIDAFMAQVAAESE